MKFAKTANNKLMKLKWQLTSATAEGILSSARFVRKFMTLITCLNIKKNIIKKSNVSTAASSSHRKVFNNTKKDANLKKHFVAIVN